MKDRVYPVLSVNTEYLRHNAKTVASKCKAAGITVAGVVKVIWGEPEAAKILASSGIDQIASSRISQLEKIKNSGVDAPLMLIRVPMISEAEKVIRIADISLHSDINVLRSFNEEALKQGKVHKVVIMMELGDLREGVYDKAEALDMALEVENSLDGLELAGVGTNLGCYGSILSTPEKMQELVDFARLIEDKIGRKLEIVSGGGTRAFARVLEGNMPEGINHLRIGCQILLARELHEVWDFDLSDMHRDVFELHAEIVELREKPTHPFGEIGVDAFRRIPVYEDRGIRKKALVAMGKADYGMDIDEAYADEVFRRNGLNILFDIN